MFKSSKYINIRLFIMFLGVLIAAVSIKDLIASRNFSVEKRKFSATADYSSEIEKRIRAGTTSTAALIVDYHPRLWMRSNWDWDAFDQIGSFAWRIVHGEPLPVDDPANDQEKYEFCTVTGLADEDGFGAVEYDTFGRRYLWTIIAAEARKRLNEWNLPQDLPGTSWDPDYYPQHTEDELLADARAKLLFWVEEGKSDYSYVGASGILTAAVGYDWLVNRKYSNGVTPVISEADRAELQAKLINVAESMRSEAQGKGFFFNGDDIALYCYFIAGLALYEPSGQGISASNNAKAKQYLDEFDEYWIKKILPVLNEQGGTGGWHEGFPPITSEFFRGGSGFVYRLAPFLFAHYTATGQSFENSVFSTGILKYGIEFQNHMIYPDMNVAIGSISEDRYQWITPMFPNARRRFSSDPEQQWLGELTAWFRNEILPGEIVDEGSYDMFDQLLWEEKFPNPRSANVLGCGTRHFAKLGWVCMRSGFTSPNDLAALFICQRYHWSDQDLYAQNSFMLERKGKLIEGYRNTIWIDGQYQRTISGFPHIADGVEAYASGSKYDVGPGIQNFESTDEYDYMCGDATNAYDPIKLEKFTRGLVWIKSNNTWVMFDRVVTKDAGVKKSWVIDPGTAPKSEGDRLVKITNGSGALWVKRLLPEQVTETMSASKFEVVPAQSAKEVYFLYVMQAVDASLAKDTPEVVADDAQLIAADNRIGVKVDGWTILFDKMGTAEISVTKTKVKNESQNNLDFRLFQNYPNPFNALTDISYTLPVKSDVKLDIYNVLGQKIKSLVNSSQDAGVKSVSWNGLEDHERNVATGIYFYRLEVDDFVSIKKMMFLQ